MNRNNEFRKNWKFQERYYDQFVEIMKRNARHIINISVADESADMKQATDFVITINGGSVAARIRRSNVKYRDLTIRSYNNGYKTEIDKIRQGFADFYLYCWAGNEQIIEYILIDVEKLRASGLLEQKRQIFNKDGKTAFIAIPPQELEKNGCLIRTEKRG